MTDQKQAQAHKDYFETKILSATPVEIVHMLYGVAIENLNAAIGYLKTGNIGERSRAVTKAQTAVHELMFALDPKADAALCRTLAELYDYVQNEIITGNIRRSAPAFENAVRVLTMLSEGWSGVKADLMGEGQAAANVGAEQREEPVEAPPMAINPWAAPQPVAATGRDWSC